jgi:predicted negative regulator of RcsB-dependent stress response
MAMAQLYEDPLLGDFFKTVKRYKVHFITLLICAFLSVSAYSYYLSSLKIYNVMAMNYYIQYLDARESNDITTEIETISLLQNKYSSHLYSTLASLSHSAKLIKQSEIVLAKKNLNWVVSHSPALFFKDLARYKQAEIAKNELQDKELGHIIGLIQSPEIQKLGQHILADALVEKGLFVESQNLYNALIESCDDPAYQALLTSEYHISNLLDS